MAASTWRGKEQSFFGLISVTVNTYEKLWDTNGKEFLRGEVVVKNVGAVPLKEVNTYVDLDDTGNFWDVIFVNSSGTPVASLQTLTYGDLAPGQSASQLFWYRVQPSVSGLTPQETFVATVKAIPVFRVDTRGYGLVTNTTDITTKG